MRPEAWAGVRDCTVTGPRCVQGPGVLFLDPVIGAYYCGNHPERETLSQQPESENCLNLNVLTPGLTGKRPVMVYIHGGGFVGGSNVMTLFCERFVAEQDVVLVGINHRLNVFGYLYLGGLSQAYASGNAGQLDLIAALEWVRDNIANFGGDPGNVTIFGESGGGAKISTLLAMPAAQGLFHRAIIESGSLLQVDDPETGTATARALLAALGLNEQQLDVLERIPAADLYAALERLPSAKQGPMSPGPVIDGRTVTHQTWQPSAPPEGAGVPLLVGNCKDELTLFVGVFIPGNPEAAFRLDAAGLRNSLAECGIPVNKIDPLLALYRHAYPAESPVDLFFRITTDRGARWNATRQAELRIAQGGADVYTYYFNWNTPCGEGRLRAFHTAELPLALRLVAQPEVEPLSRQISDAWVAFARSGNPNHAGLPRWPAYTLAERATMVFDLPNSAVVNDPDSEMRRMLRDYPAGSLL
jgi:para-nitrobenzyl esterase